MYMEHDQYGTHYSIAKHPRKELCEQFDVKHAAKMYIDRPDGAYHVGYIIAIIPLTYDLVWEQSRGYTRRQSSSITNWARDRWTGGRGNE